MAQHEAEWLTRKKRIDTRLKALGWTIVPFDPDRPLGAYHRHAITEYETANGPADYALAVDGVLLGIVEAKKVRLGPQNVLIQAERYSKGQRPTRSTSAASASHSFIRPTARSSGFMTSATR